MFIIAGMKHHDQNPSITERSQDRNRALSWRQELVQGSWRGSRRNAAYWLAPYGLLNLFSYRTQIYQPRGETSVIMVGWDGVMVNPEFRLLRRQLWG